MGGSLVGSKVSLTGPTATLATVVSLSTRRMIVQYVPIVACISSFFVEYSTVVYINQGFLRCFPDLYCVIGEAGGNEAAVGRPCHGA